nr:6-hydroxy-D-nicotine oxidase [Paraburkholderia busanensis]
MCALDRRTVLKGALVAPWWGASWRATAQTGQPNAAAAASTGAANAANATNAGAAATASTTADLANPTGPTLRRVRPSDPDWPSADTWQALNESVGGRLRPITSALAVCHSDPAGDACANQFKQLKNPFYIGDTPSLTQTCGWLDAWTSAPSEYVVAATHAQDVAKAIDFARRHRLRLVVRGGAHSYQGTSNAADSLMVWTRAMHDIDMHDAFVPAGCAGRVKPQPAVSVGAGAMWGHVYAAVSARGGRYVQGGGCLTVGVAGLVQSGGFGSFSKKFGSAAAGLLEAEVVTADGVVRIANACTHPDLFWALKGGGGGSFGVVTRLTLRTHDLPAEVGVVIATVKASSDDAFRALVHEFVSFAAASLVNEHWGETVALHTDNTLHVGMVYQGLDHETAVRVWQPFFDWVANGEHGCTMNAPHMPHTSGQRFWDSAYLMEHVPGALLKDTRPDADAGNVFWADNLVEAGQYLNGYTSTWLPAALLAPAQRGRLADTLFETTRRWSISLQFNKALAKAPPDAVSATRDTATNPAVLDAFALAIIGDLGKPAMPGIAGHEPDLIVGRRNAARIEQATQILRSLVPEPGAYLSESDFFEDDWRQAFWGDHHARLAAVKRKYDPDGLFFVHHGIGSEAWSADGMTRVV